MFIGLKINSSDGSSTDSAWVTEPWFFSFVISCRILKVRQTTAATRTPRSRFFFTPLFSSCLHTTVKTFFLCSNSQTKDILLSIFQQNRPRFVPYLVGLIVLAVPSIRRGKKPYNTNKKVQVACSRACRFFAVLEIFLNRPFYKIPLTFIVDPSFRDNLKDHATEIIFRLCLII